jgi:hypothetical protein
LEKAQGIYRAHSAAGFITGLVCFLLQLPPLQDFINAYKLYAVRLGVPRDVEVSDEELRKENWIHVWDDLARKWPQVAQRFPKDDEVELGK